MSSRYGGDHQCEVPKGDIDRAVSDLRYDLERRIDDLRNEVGRLEYRLRSLREEVAGIYAKQ